MENEKPKLKQVRRFASLIRAFASVNDEHDEYLESSMEFDANGNTTREVKYLQDGNPEEVSSFVYDANNKLTEHELEYVPDETSEKRVLERDEKGRVVRETKYYGESAGERTEYSYNDDILLEVRSYDEEGEYLSKEVFEYKGQNLSSRIAYDKDDTVLEKKEYSHSDDGLDITESVSDNRGILQRTTNTVLNADKKEVDSVEKTGQGKLISAVHSEYDAHGNLVERRIKDFYSKRHIFVYDENNRCTEDALYDDNNNLLRRHQYEFDAEGHLLSEQSYEMDVTRGGRDKHMAIRYEYEYYPD